KPASYGWPTVRNSNTNAQFDIVRDDPAAAHPKVEGWIQRDLAVSLFKRAGLDFEALKKQAQTRDFKPVVLEGETFSAHYDVAVDKITSHNVVGRITGSKPRTKPSSTARIGITSASAHPTTPATASTTARSTTPPA